MSEDHRLPDVPHVHSTTTQSFGTSRQLSTISDTSQHSEGFTVTPNMEPDATCVRSEVKTHAPLKRATTEPKAPLTRQVTIDTDGSSIVDFKSQLRPVKRNSSRQEKARSEVEVVKPTETFARSNSDVSRNSSAATASKTSSFMASSISSLSPEADVCYIGEQAESTSSIVSVVPPAGGNGKKKRVRTSFKKLRKGAEKGMRKMSAVSRGEHGSGDEDSFNWI